MSTETHTGRGPRTKRGLRPLADQVVVITGGSSGIGRETALRFGRAGATVVVLARGEEGLATTVEAITRDGGTAQAIVCDMTDPEAVRDAVSLVESLFGRVDTWVSNAGTLQYGSFEDTSAEEFRAVLEVNLIGTVNGIHAALPALHRAGGGALICVTSVEAVITLPLHTAYGASKRAVEGALDGLRRELKAQGAPVSLTVVRPSVIDTPIFGHARTQMPWKPTAPPPYYDPAVVAQAIVFAATHPVRTIHAGGGGRFLVAAQTMAPGVVDAMLGRLGDRLTRTEERAPLQPGNFREALPGDTRGGELPRRGRRWSAHTWLAVHPGIRRTAAVAAAGTVLLALRRRHR